MQRLRRLLMADGKINPAGGSGAKEARDSACTPQWLADVIGRVDLDVASNNRSHIDAAVSLTLEGGDNGLYSESEPRSYSQRVEGWDIDRSAVVKADTRVFCNPPYARGQVIRWVKHWRSTRFIFLLRWDPSTEWFAELIHHCTHVWFPARRINFEPPPGVKFSSNPFPHALYLRDPDPELVGRLARNGYLMRVDEEFLDIYLEQDEGHPDGDDGGGNPGEGIEGGAGGGGGQARGGTPEVWAKPNKWVVDDLWSYGWKSKVDLSKIYKYKGDPPKLTAPEPEWKTRAKAAGNCGDCLDCKQGFGWCVWKTEQYRREF